MKGGITRQQRIVRAKVRDLCCKQRKPLTFHIRRPIWRYNGHVHRFTDLVISTIQECMWIHTWSSFLIRCITLRQWKDGWLIILEVESEQGKAWKSFAFGATPTEAISKFWYKVKERKMDWKINER